MTDKELIDGFLSGELDEAGLAQLEVEFEKNPELLHELSEQQELDNVLRVLLGDETADQQVTVSVLGVVRGKSLDDFKSRLMTEVKQSEEKKKKAEARRVATNKIPHVAAPTPANPIPIDAVRAAAMREPARRSWGWGLAAGIAACLAVGYLAWEFFAPKPPVPENTGAFLVASTRGVEVHRGDKILPAGRDMLLEPGDRIVVGESAKAQMGFHADTSRVTLKSGAVVHLVRGGRSKRLELRAGSVDAIVALQTGAPLVIETTLTEARIQSGEVNFLSGSDFSRLEVMKGSALLVRKSDGKSVRVSSRQFVVAASRVDFEPMRGPFEDVVKGAEIVAYLKQVKGKVFLFTKSPAERTPATVGQPIRAHHGIVTEGKNSRALVEYLDQTRLEIAADTTVRRFAKGEKSPEHKLVRLDEGVLKADVVKQPKGRPMKLTTPHADVEVLGTRFELRHDKGATRVQVEEGAVKFTQRKAGKTVVVRAGFFALAASSHMFDPEVVPGGLLYVDIDLSAGDTDGGDGEWTVDGRTLRQNRVSRAKDDADPSPISNHRYKVDLKEGAVLEATIEVTRVTPDMSSERGAWGFGLVSVFGNRTIVLRTHQGSSAGSVFEFGGLNRTIPFEHGREGRYRLKLRIERPEGGVAVLRGKLWQGDREPDGWMILDHQELSGNMTFVGLQTIRCAGEFTSFRVRDLKTPETPKKATQK